MSTQNNHEKRIRELELAVIAMLGVLLFLTILALVAMIA